MLKNRLPLVKCLTATSMIGGLTLLAAGPASAGTGPQTPGVTIQNTSGQAIAPGHFGASNTNYQFGVPSGSACSGDTATDHYQIETFVEPASFNLANLTYSVGQPSTGSILYDNSGNSENNINTIAGSGQIPNPLPSPILDFEFNAYGVDFSAGAYNIGIMCITPTGTPDKWWSAGVTFENSASDPNGFEWEVTPSGTATSTTLASSANPSVTGQKVTLTATVTPTPDGGTVAFAVGGKTITACAAQPLTSGSATCVYGPTAKGSLSLTAAYSGDATFFASTSSALTQTVNPAKTTTTLKSSLNPSTVGQKVTFTATLKVTAPGSGSPTGTVTFKDGGVAITACSAAAVKAGKATCAVTYTSTGSHSITATYNGSTSFSGSTAKALKQVVN